MKFLCRRMMYIDQHVCFEINDLTDVINIVIIIIMFGIFELAKLVRDRYRSIIVTALKREGYCHNVTSARNWSDHLYTGER